jgi:prevent-host-death family protein
VNGNKRYEIAQRELRNEYKRVVQDVSEGATVTVTDRGRPVAKIEPIDQRRVFVPVEETLRLLGRGPEIDYEQWLVDVRPADRQTTAELADPFERWSDSSSTRAS